MYSTAQFKRGLKIEIEGTPFQIVEFQHVKPGKGPAFVRTKLKNMLTGKILDRTFRSGEKVGEADIEDRSMQYLYHDGDGYVVMDHDTFEQISVPEEVVGDNTIWMLEDTEVNVLFYKGDPVSVDVPDFMILEIVETDPGVRGDTAQGGSKPAVLSTGAKINVPLFVNEGEKIKVDTRTATYLERAK